MLRLELLFVQLRFTPTLTNSDYISLRELSLPRLISLIAWLTKTIHRIVLASQPGTQGGDIRKISYFRRRLR